MAAVIGVVSVTKRDKHPGSWSYATVGRRTRAFRNRDERGDKTRIYFSPADETVMEQFLVGRHTRPYEEYRKLVPQVLAEVGIRHDTKVHWSQRAGCTCPCSPGFVADVRAGFDVFVTVNQSDDAESVTFKKGDRS